MSSTCSPFSKAGDGGMSLPSFTCFSILTDNEAVEGVSSSPVPPPTTPGTVRIPDKQLSRIPVPVVGPAVGLETGRNDVATVENEPDSLLESVRLTSRWSREIALSSQASKGTAAKNDLAPAGPPVPPKAHPMASRSLPRLPPRTSALNTVLNIDDVPSDASLAGSAAKIGLSPAASFEDLVKKHPMSTIVHRTSVVKTVKPRSTRVKEGLRRVISLGVIPPTPNETFGIAPSPLAIPRPVKTSAAAMSSSASLGLGRTVYLDATLTDACSSKTLPMESSSVGGHSLEVAPLKASSIEATSPRESSHRAPSFRAVSSGASSLRASSPRAPSLRASPLTPSPSRESPPAAFPANPSSAGVSPVKTSSLPSSPLEMSADRGTPKSRLLRVSTSRPSLRKLVQAIAPSRSMPKLQASPEPARPPVPSAERGLSKPDALAEIRACLSALAERLVDEDNRDRRKVLHDVSFISFLSPFVQCLPLVSCFG